MNSSTTARIRSLLALGAILILATVLRVATVGRESLWFDEAISYLTAMLPPSAILGNAVHDPHPPFYYLLLHLWYKTGMRGDALIRLPDVFWSLLLIPVVYALALKLYSRRQLALIAALLVAISPFHIFYSHELRMYALLMFLISASLLAYLKARESDGWRWWLAFGLLALLAIYTHLFALIVLFAVGVHALSQRQNQRALRRTVFVGVVLLLLFLPWVLILLGESQYDLGSLRPLAQGGEQELVFLKLLTTFIFLLFGYSTHTWYSGLALFLFLGTSVVYVMEMLKVRRSKIESDDALPLLVITCVISIPITIYALRPFFLPERTMAAAAPFLSLVLACATTRRQTPLPYLVAASGILMVVGTVLYVVSEPIKPPYRDVANFIGEHRVPGDAILHTSDGSYLPALRYVSFDDHGLLQGDPDPRKPLEVYKAYGGELWTVQEAGKRGQRLWLIVAREHSISWQEEQLAYFEATFKRLASHHFEGITINLYDTGAR